MDTWVDIFSQTLDKKETPKSIRELLLEASSILNMFKEKYWETSQEYREIRESYKFLKEKLDDALNESQKYTKQELRILKLNLNNDLRSVWSDDGASGVIKWKFAWALNVAWRFARWVSNDRLDSSNMSWLNATKMTNQYQEDLLNEIFWWTDRFNDKYIAWHREDIWNYVRTIDEFEIYLKKTDTKILWQKEDPNVVNSRELANYFNYLERNWKLNEQTILEKFNKSQIWDITKVLKENNKNSLFIDTLNAPVDDIGIMGRFLKMPRDKQFWYLVKYKENISRFKDLDLLEDFLNQIWSGEYKDYRFNLRDFNPEVKWDFGFIAKYLEVSRGVENLKFDAFDIPNAAISSLLDKWFLDKVQDLPKKLDDITDVDFKNKINEIKSIFDIASELDAWSFMSRLSVELWFENTQKIAQILNLKIFDIDKVVSNEWWFADLNTDTTNNKLMNIINFKWSLLEYKNLSTDLTYINGYIDKNWVKDIWEQVLGYLKKEWALIKHLPMLIYAIKNEKLWLEWADLKDFYDWLIKIDPLATAYIWKERYDKVISEGDTDFVNLTYWLMDKYTENLLERWGWYNDLVDIITSMDFGEDIWLLYWTYTSIYKNFWQSMAVNVFSNINVIDEVDGLKHKIMNSKSYSWKEYVGFLDNITENAIDIKKTWEKILKRVEDGWIKDILKTQSDEILLKIDEIIWNLDVSQKILELITLYLKWGTKDKDMLFLSINGLIAWTHKFETNEWDQVLRGEFEKILKYVINLEKEKITVNKWDLWIESLEESDIDWYQKYISENMWDPGLTPEQKKENLDRYLEYIARKHSIEFNDENRVRLEELLKSEINLKELEFRADNFDDYYNYLSKWYFLTWESFNKYLEVTKSDREFAKNIWADRSWWFNEVKQNYLSSRPWISDVTQISWWYQYIINWEKLILNLDEAILVSKSKENTDNIINFRDTLNELWISWLWTYREWIFRALENKNSARFNLKDNYLGADEIKVFLLWTIWALWIDIWNLTNLEEIKRAVKDTNNVWDITWQAQQNEVWRSTLEQRFIEEFDENRNGWVNIHTLTNKMSSIN